MRQTSLPCDFFAGNRAKLCREMTADALVFLQSAPVTIRNADNFNHWRQDSDFFYYTGIKYPDCSLILVPNGDGNMEEYLFIPPVDPEKEKWLGKMLTREEAQKISGIKAVQTNDTLTPTLYRLQKWREVLYCQINENFPDLSLTPQHLFLEDLKKRIPGLQLKKLSLLSAPQRMQKQPGEIALIRQSLAIMKSALESVAGKLQAGLKEYQLEAELSYRYTYEGCKRHGFDPIVASGVNATILHYVENSDTLKDGDLILIDTGGEFEMYSGDITRVYPINGQFSERQKQCYQAVLDVNKAFIKELKPGYTWNQLYKTAGEIIGETYTRYGFITDPQKHVEVSYHRIGHFLGLDIHDVGRLDEPMTPGTIITVEPGLYLSQEGIGVRIEDNVLFTESGFEVLSSDIPKEIEEIEALVAG